MPTAVVTGANSGIGHAFAQLLLQEGHKVHAVDRNSAEGLMALSSSGAHTSELDVTSIDSINRFKQSIGDEPVDLLLNIAGIAVPPEKDALDNTTLEIFQKTFAVNTYGPMFLTQALLPNVVASQDKKIGIVTSRVGSVGDNSTGGHYAYRSSKAAANQIGKSMAMDLKDKGVTVLLLHPGYVKSGILPHAVMPLESVMPEEAATKLWNNVVKPKGIEETGTFWHREGFELQW